MRGHSYIYTEEQNGCLNTGKSEKPSSTFLQAYVLFLSWSALKSDQYMKNTFFVLSPFPGDRPFFRRRKLPQKSTFGSKKSRVWNILPTEQIFTFSIGRTVFEIWFLKNKIFSQKTVFSPFMAVWRFKIMNT